VEKAERSLAGMLPPLVVCRIFNKTCMDGWDVFAPGRSGRARQNCVASADQEARGSEGRSAARWAGPIERSGPAVGVKIGKLSAARARSGIDRSNGRQNAATRISMGRHS
jgi:hypothetical protein